MSSRPSLLCSTALLTLVGLAGQALGFLYRIALARLVGAQVLGLYQLLMPAYAVLQSVCISGLAVGVSLLTAEFHAHHNQRALGQTAALALGLLTALWGAIALLVRPGSGWIAQHLLGQVQLGPCLVLLLPVLLLTGVENVQKHFFYGLGHSALPGGIELGEQLIRCAAILLLLTLCPADTPEASVALIVVGMLISEVFSAAALTWARLRRRPAIPQGSAVPPSRLVRRLLGIALPVGLTALAGNLLGAATSILLPRLLERSGVSAAQAMESFGVLLGMTAPILMLPMALVNALSLALLPRLTECHALGQDRRFCALGEQALLAVSYLVLPLILLLAVWGPTLGQLLFAEARVGQFIWPMALGVVASAYHAILGGMLNALGRQRSSAAISLFCGALELGCTLVLVPRLGLRGFVVGFVTADLLAVALCLWLVRRCVGLHLPLFSGFVLPLLAALLASLTVQLGARLAPESTLLLWAALGPVLYLAALLAQGVGPKTLLRRVRRCNLPPEAL